MSIQKPIATQNSSRREFVQVSAGLAALGCSTIATNVQGAEAASSSQLVRPGDTILFQGDSITDVGRDRKTASKPNLQAPLGGGYAWLTAASLLVDRPDDGLRIFNRGISGNKVHQLAKRWQQDCLDIRPDIVSILIGVNDIWHTLNKQYKGTVEIYERDYQALVEQTKAELPDVRLVICEPFVLRCGAVNDSWFPEFDGYRAAARRVCSAAGATFVPFQEMFDRAIQHAPPTHWAKDGVHPSAAGAALMANCWLRSVQA